MTTRPRPRPRSRTPRGTGSPPPTPRRGRDAGPRTSGIEGNPELQRVVRSMLFYLLCSADRALRSASRRWGSRAAATTATSSGTPIPGCSRPLLLPIPTSPIRWWRSAPARSTRPAPTPGPTASAARCTPGRPTSADARPLPSSPCRTRAPRSTSPATSPWRSGSTTSRPGTPPGWRARAFPVIRATADFWVSRATRDRPRRYHIANVVSVAEGLIGVTDDAYTNAVARKNLEIATAASRRLGQPARPAWTGRGQAPPAVRLGERVLPHLRRRARLHPRRGHAAPGYPLGVTMSAAPSGPSSSRQSPLLAEGPGAMMGSTLLSVDAAELGDRALVDSLLPLSYRGHLKGPFLMLSETPSNDAVNFVTGAGGFLQQVIFGYTGLRFGERGLEPAFAPVLPSSDEAARSPGRLARGRRYDVRGRRARTAHRAPDERIRPMSSLALLLRSAAPAGAERRAARSLRCSPFPSPGWTIRRPTGATRPASTATPGETRCRSTSSREAARSSLVWADAANESVGFTVARCGGPGRARLGRRGRRGERFGRGSHARVPPRRRSVPRSSWAGWCWLDASGARLPVRPAAPAAIHRAAFRVAGGVAAGRDVAAASGGGARRTSRSSGRAAWMSSAPGFSRPSPPAQSDTGGPCASSRARSTAGTTWCSSSAGARADSAARAAGRSVTIRSRTGAGAIQGSGLDQRGAAHPAFAARRSSTREFLDFLAEPTTRAGDRTPRGVPGGWSEKYAASSSSASKRS